MANERIQSVIDLYHDRGASFSWWVGPLDTVQDLPTRLPNFGFELKFHTQGMVADLTTYKEKPALSTSPSTLIIEPVRNLEQLKQFDEVHTACGMSKGVFDVVYVHTPPRLFEGDAPIQCFVGYIKFVPVVSGMLTFHAGVAGIYNVCTVPSERLRGYGERMIETMLSAAITRGYRYATILSEKRGLRAYEAVGFQSVCTFHKFYYEFRDNLNDGLE